MERGYRKNMPGKRRSDCVKRKIAILLISLKVLLILLETFKMFLSNINFISTSQKMGVGYDMAQSV